MKTKSLSRVLASIAIATTASFSAHAADPWPSKTITLVVPFPAGGGTDIVARALGQRLSMQLKVPVVVENKPGAATAIGAEAVARAPADGNTLLVSGASTFSINPAIRPKLRYDPLRDFVPVGIVAKVPLLLTVNATSPFKSVADVVAAAKARPGVLNYATFGSGSSSHLAGSMFASAAGIQLTDVGYRGSSPALVALMSGEVEMTMDTAAAVGSQVAAGKLRVLANFDSERTSAMPKVPTMAEQGLAAATFEGWYGLAAPKGTPPDIVQRLWKEVAAAMHEPAVKAQLASQSIEPTLVPSEQMREKIETELSRYRALAARVNLKLD